MTVAWIILAMFYTLSFQYPTGPTDFTGMLCKLAREMQWEQPKFRDLERTGPDHDPIFTVEVDACNRTTRASARSKVQARRAASAEMLTQLCVDSFSTPGVVGIQISEPLRLENGSNCIFLQHSGEVQPIIYSDDEEVYIAKRKKVVPP